MSKQELQMSRHINITAITSLGKISLQAGIVDIQADLNYVLAHRCLFLTFPILLFGVCPNLSFLSFNERR